MESALVFLDTSQYVYSKPIPSFGEGCAMDGPLARMLASKSPVILDGAMGTELQRREVDTGLPLWSANALMVHPEIVLQIHKDYIEAGADIITANTFRTTRRTFHRAHLPDRSLQMTRNALALVRQAREAFPDRAVLIAGSMAPLEDCYRPDLVPDESELRDEHSELAERLAEGGVDFILIETINTIREALAACKAAKATGKEVVVSFICNNEGRLLSGESLSEAIVAVTELSPTMFSINCVAPRSMKRSVEILKRTTHLPYMLYGNIGLPEGNKDGWEFTRDVSEDEYAQFAVEWHREGASVIGGCCGTTPAYVRAVAARHATTQSQ